MNGLLTPQRSAGTIIELSFRLLGRTIPVDHGYALYAALSRVVPELHDAQELGIQPVRGVYAREALSTTLGAKAQSGRLVQLSEMP